MATNFKGIVNIDVRDSVPDWTPFREAPAPADGRAQRPARALR